MGRYIDGRATPHCATKLWRESQEATQDLCTCCHSPRPRRQFAISAAWPPCRSKDPLPAQGPTGSQHTATGAVTLVGAEMLAYKTPSGHPAEDRLTGLQRGLDHQQTHCHQKERSRGRQPHIPDQAGIIIELRSWRSKVHAAIPNPSSRPEKSCNLPNQCLCSLHPNIREAHAPFPVVGRQRQVNHPSPLPPDKDPPAMVAVVVLVQDLDAGSPSFRTACSGLDWRRVPKSTAAAWRRAGASRSAHGCTNINRS